MQIVDQELKMSIGPKTMAIITSLRSFINVIKQKELSVIDELVVSIIDARIPTEGLSLLSSWSVINFSALHEDIEAIIDTIWAQEEDRGDHCVTKYQVVLSDIISGIIVAMEHDFKSEENCSQS